MNHGMRWLVAVMLLGMAACARREPAPAEPARDEAAVQREHYFGAQAAAPDIAWRTSGLGIRVLAPGEGASPQLTDRVLVHYVGKLKDGKVFDDSRARGKPAEFVVNRLITGWAAAMPALMPGARAELFIPPHLGYGGIRSGMIPPHSGLIFEVELLAVNPEPPGPK